MPEELAGATLETVLLGPLLAGRLRIWRADGTAVLLRPDDPAAVEEVVGRGLLARTSPEPGRFREVALYEPGAGVLVLLDRPRESGGGAEAAGRQVAVDPAGQPVDVAEAWEGAADVWRDAVTAAAGRGEFVVIEPGGWEAGTEPYALAIVVAGDDGTMLSHLEAVPTPAGGLWPDEPRGPLRAPATAGTMAVTGLLLRQAVAGWAASPLDTVLTFGASPYGPYTPSG